MVYQFSGALSSLNCLSLVAGRSPVSLWQVFPLFVAFRTVTWLDMTVSVSRDGTSASWSRGGASVSRSPRGASVYRPRGGASVFRSGGGASVFDLAGAKKNAAAPPPTKRAIME